MAEGLKYPKELTKEIEVKIKTENSEIKLLFHDALRELAIVPYFGFWGVLEILKRNMGSDGFACVRLLESYQTFQQAKAYLEGFMAGNQKRRNK
jgi:hypothetical protein